MIEIPENIERILDSFHGRDSRLQSRFSQRLLLRHDVDHNLNLALRLAERHAHYGTQATFFIRTDTAYAQEDDFLQKIKYLSSLGHEIGYHCNAFYTSTQTKKPLASEVMESLELLRKASKVTGVAAHGDKHLYEAGVSNLWTWHENKSKYLARSFPNKRLNAEGTIAQGSDKYLETPQPGSVSNGDLSPETFSVHMKDFGLEYEAVFIGTHRYWSDSGGKWIRTGQPAKESLDNGYHQVLIHPEYVFRAKKPIFLFSFPRSGTKYTRDLLRELGIGDMQHETSLNRTRYSYANNAIFKRTNFGMCELMNRPPTQEQLMDSWLKSAYPKFGKLNGVVEPYAGFLDPSIMRKISDQTEAAILVRDPVEAIMSLAIRGWHGQPLHNRPRMNEVAEWEELTQLEKLSLLWSDAYQKFIQFCGRDRVIRLEDIAVSPVAPDVLFFDLESRAKSFLPQTKVDSTLDIVDAPLTHPKSHEIQKIWSIVGEVASSLGYVRGENYSLRPPLPLLSDKVLSDFASSDEVRLRASIESQIGSDSNRRIMQTFPIHNFRSTSFMSWKVSRKTISLGAVLRVFIGPPSDPLCKEVGRLDSSFSETSGSFGADSFEITQITILINFPIGARWANPELNLSVRIHDLIT